MEIHGPVNPAYQTPINSQAVKLSEQATTPVKK
jgi:hypothetical protein